VGALETLGCRRDGVVRGPEHGQSRGAKGDRSPGVRQFPPQPPGRRQEEVDEATQGDATLCGSFSGPAIAGQFRGGQAAARAGRVEHSGQVVREQFRGHSAGLTARRAGDRGQIGRR